jgi:16S rRNA (guanine527-N7)-methyltransferase
VPAPPAVPAAAEAVFGDRLPLAVRYAELLADTGVRHGLLGPREADRIWERHLLNCAVVSEVLPAGARIVDVGSGAGLPGLPLALVRSDLKITLLEPMARRVAWLDEVVAKLAVPVRVHRGRAEDAAVRSALGHFDVATARAVAPLGRLAGWALPLLRPGGLLVAMKGERAADEVAAERVDVHRYGGRAIRLHDCGAGMVNPVTKVVLVERSDAPERLGRRRGR